MTIKLLVVEDDHFTLSMVAQALESVGMPVVLATTSAREALEAAKNATIDVAILDLHLGPGPTGIDLAIALRKIQATIGLVLLTSFEDPRLLSPSLPSLPEGAVYVTKKQMSGMSSLIKQIELASTWRQRTATPANPRESKVSHLTDGQLELLRLMAHGLTNAEIAKQKFVTEKSIETAIRRLVTKLGIKHDPSRNQRVHIAKVYFEALGRSIGDE